MNLLISLFLALSVAADNIRTDLANAGITAVFPDQSAYANASKPFNLRYDYQPALVAYPNSAEQVSEIVKFGNSFGLHIAARSGGHSYIANSLGNGTIVIDLSNLTKITYNPATTTILVETGNRLGDVALALSNVGRALPHGTCPYVGIGGHAGHGGFGFTSRLWGLTVDNIVSANMVLANGTIATASQSLNSDLFWTIRGSASSFAIVTSYEFKTHAAPSYAIIYQYNWQLNYTLAGQALDLFQEFTKTNLPPQFGAEIVLTPGAIPGNVSFGLTGTWYGPKSQENVTVQPFLKAMPPINTVHFIGNGTWIDNLVQLAGGSLNTSLAPDNTDTFYAKSLIIPESAPLTSKASTAFMRYLANEGLNATTQLSWFLEVELFGGSNSAINAVPLDATSFGRRDSLFTIQFYTSSLGNVPPFPDLGFTLMDGMVDSITSNMPKDWAYGAYLNYIDDQLADWQKRYYASHYPRLETLKREFDPRDVFDFPVSVQE